MHDTLANLAALLRCPNCGGALALLGEALRCERGHSFDIARAGYVTLPPPRHALAAGDTAEMVAARAAVLGSGHFAALTDALLAAADAEIAEIDDGAPMIADLGAGTGHHLAALLRAHSRARGIALDSSRPALRRAVRAHPRLAAVLCDVWRGLPLQSESVELAINVFAPRNGPEIARVLACDGALIVVTPGPRHLEEIVGRLGMLRVREDKQAHLQATLSPALELAERRDVEFAMALERHEIEALIAMGPSAHHLSAEDVRGRLADQGPGTTEVTASVTIETFRPAAR